MGTTSPARIDDDVYAAAKLVGALMSRSASQQVAHWAWIGRELEAADSVSHAHIAEVLSGARSYDGLSDEEQAAVRAEWSERLTVRRERLNLASVFAAEGRSWVELDDDGNVVTRNGVTHNAAASDGPASDGSASGDIADSATDPAA